MPLWKTLLLSGYYHASLPLRAWHNARLRAAGRAPIMVLFYHRIADDHPTPWTATNAVFERQVRWIRRHFDIVSLDEATRRIRAPRNTRPCVGLTFDDGYADNCRRALPWLIRERIPFTYFISTHHVLTGEPFAHDAARGCPLPVNTPKQIRELADAGVEIGAHTRRHPDLGPITDPERLHEELIVARDEVEAMTGKPVRYFAFPFGQHANLNTAALQMTRDAGYEAVFSAYGGYNFPGDDSFLIQRIHGDDDFLRLKNWLTLDPKKLRSIRRYQYQLQPYELPADAAGVCA